MIVRGTNRTLDMLPLSLLGMLGGRSGFPVLAVVAGAAAILTVVGVAYSKGHNTAELTNRARAAEDLLQAAEVAHRVQEEALMRATAEQIARERAEEERDEILERGQETVAELEASRASMREARERAARAEMMLTISSSTSTSISNTTSEADQEIELCPESCYLLELPPQ